MLTRIRWSGAAAVLLLSAASPARSQGRPEIKSWTLENGLEVVFLAAHRAPVVAVQVWYHAGSKDEPRDRRGSAHMFEHMMFKGTVHVPPDEHARLIDRVGGQAGAYTTWDATFYQATVPRQHLDFAMRLEAERMRNLVFRKAMVAREREVVKEERRVRVDNQPIARAVERLTALAFTRHPYAWGPTGVIEELDRLTPEELNQFYDTYYVPKNATLVVVGDATEDAVRDAAARHFGAIPAGAEPPRPAEAAKEPPQTKLRREVLLPAQLGVVVGGFHVPEARHEDTYALNVAASLLVQGESSRLYQRVVRKDRIGVAAGGQLISLEHPGLFLVFGACLKPEQREPLEQALLEEVSRLGAEPVTQGELDKAKNQLAAGFVFALENVTGLAQQIGMSKIQTGDPRAWLAARDRLQAVTASDVQRVARKYLVSDNATFVVVPPKGNEP